MAKAETSAETYGKKKRRSVASLLGMGFQYIAWNGM
jgi:hypothetical protein